MQKVKIISGIFIFLFTPGLISGQLQKGKILSSSTNSTLAYVNVIVEGRNMGTVSDESGYFTINLDKFSDEDSLHFSMIGYEPKSLLIRHFKEDSIKNIYLEPKCYDFEELVMTCRKPKTKKITLGTPVLPNYIKSGFSDNTLGSEMAVKVNAKGRVKLKNINLNVATCTFDTVTYRLNIYQSTNQSDYKNILTVPIYISFSRDLISQPISIDLTDYSIIIEGNTVIALELYKDLGEGKLLFHTDFFAGSTHFRKANDSNWAETSGVIGMYLNGSSLR